MIDKGSSRDRSKRRVHQAAEPSELEFNASPDDFDSEEAPPEPEPTALKRSRPNNIQETRAWKDGVGGARRFWHNYLNALKIAFNRLDRHGQEDLIIRMSQIITLGAAIVTTYIWYWFMPQGIRIFVLPVVLLGSWWAGTKIVGPSMITRLEPHLHQDDYYD